MLKEIPSPSQGKFSFKAQSAFPLKFQQKKRMAGNDPLHKVAGRAIKIKKYFTLMPFN
jgi:hypothetical protein